MHAPATKLTHRATVILNAYSQGVFPMADSSEGDVGWYLPTQRGILPLDDFHVPRRLAKTIHQEKFQVTRDQDFEAVIQHCAQPAQGREETWISEEIMDAYCELHELGFAHSIEVRQFRRLVGGLYGVSLKGLFAGESMFSLVRDASKVALVHLVDHLRASGFVLLDTQFYTPHLGQFGAVEISDETYQRLLAAALKVNARF